jgi:hypothetical protein
LHVSIVRQNLFDDFAKQARERRRFARGRNRDGDRSATHHCRRDRARILEIVDGDDEHALVTRFVRDARLNVRVVRRGKGEPCAVQIPARVRALRPRRVPDVRAKLRRDHDDVGTRARELACFPRRDLPSPDHDDALSFDPQEQRHEHVFIIQDSRL